MIRLIRLLLTHDFAPRLSGPVRRAVGSPLGVLLLAAGAAGLCGLAIHPRVFALAGGLLGAAAAGVCWPWLTARAVRAAVRFDRPRATEGDEVGAAAAVTNPLPWPAWGLTVRDPGAGTAVRLPAVGGRTRTAYRWVFVPLRRGEYPAAAPRVGTGFPFGLWEAARPAAVDGRLVVWPRTLPVGPVPTTDGGDVVEGNVTRNKVGSTGDVLGVRPYRRGDSPRRIHWAQSARHDRLIVCELQSNSRPVVLVVLDADPAAHTSGPDGSREWAVRVAASLARGWLEAGAQVGLACGGVVIPPRAGAAQVPTVLDALARLPDGGPPLAAVLTSPPVRAARDVLRVVVTSDAGFDRGHAGPGGADARWVVLDRSGFGGAAGASRPRPRAWLDLSSAAGVPHRLRHGTGEASHGS